MKKIALLLLLTPLVMAMQCNEDDMPRVHFLGLSGSYTLTNVSGGPMAINNNFEPGVITWNIDEENQTLNVINTYDDSIGTVEDILETGTYVVYPNVPDPPYGEDCSVVYVTNDLILGCPQKNDEGILTFTQLYTGGYTITLQEQ